MKKFSVLSVSLLSALVLAACSQADKASNTSSKTQVSVIPEQESSHSKNKSTANQGDKQAVWSKKQASQLAALMKNWGTTMQQQYEEYTPDKPGNFYGAEIPNSVWNGKMPLAIDSVNNQVKVKWAPSGEGPKDTYLIVACYSDYATQRYAEKHVYLFAIYNGQPYTLVSMQNQGNEKNSFVFSQTQNTDLKGGFEQIFHGQGVPSAYAGGSSSSNSSKSQSSSKDQAGLPVSTEQALQAYYTLWMEYNNRDSLYEALQNHTISDIIIIDVSGTQVANGIVKRTFPQNTYHVWGIGTTAHIWFQRISDDEIRVYDVPSHFQDPRWDNDSVWANEQANGYMDNPHIIKLKPIDNDLLNLMKAKTKMSD
ncbi:DUF4767 domain-containing protein [Ligilactobacillus equi]|uniref:DUF4767 domain-containing protein n=1 Tax=Ligilactobacillus equi TaxID=137357 RepID=UPI002ED34C5A